MKIWRVGVLEYRSVGQRKNRNDGMMEKWNNGLLARSISFDPTFQHSIIPVFDLS
jgi:hypothetical protein